MALYALEALDDALAVTRRFLGDLGRTAWLKLAVVVLFLGGPGVNFNAFQYGFGGSGDGNGTLPGEVVPPQVGPGEWAVIAAIVGIIVLLGVVFGIVGATMEFVFVESLRSETVAVRRYWRRRWRQGIRLFGFRLVVGLLVFGGVVLLSLPLLLPLVGGVAGGVAVALLFVLLPVFLVLAVAVGLINGFTTVFVVPIMVLEDCGVLAGWRRLWPTITAQWTQYLAYAVASLFLTMLGGLVVGVAAAVLAALLLLPFGLLFAVGIGLLAVAEPLGIAALVVVGLLYGLAVAAAAALVQVPVLAYLRYYALLVLGDVEPEFDLVPDQRAAVRDANAEGA
jgi:hypothetical protein